MLKRTFRRISEAVLKADQPTIDQWFISLDQEIASAKKQVQVKAKVLEAYHNGVDGQKIHDITGIPLGTIYTWEKEDRKAKEQPQNDQNPKEL